MTAKLIRDFVFMQLSEKEIEDYIFEDLTNNSGSALANRGLSTMYNDLIGIADNIPHVKWVRQLELGPYGRLDIVGYYKCYESIIIELFELKANPIKVDDFEQILRYDHALKEYAKTIFRVDISIQINKYLIGTGFESGHYLHNNIPRLSVIEYSYDLSGIQFNRRPGSWCRPDAKEFNFIKSLHNAEAIYGYR